LVRVGTGVAVLVEVVEDTDAVLLLVGPHPWQVHSTNGTSPSTRG
jgi:hypothetical protein